jgi:hypothetical protein
VPVLSNRFPEPVPSDRVPEPALVDGSPKPVLGDSQPQVEFSDAKPDRLQRQFDELEWRSLQMLAKHPSLMDDGSSQNPAPEASESAMGLKQNANKCEDYQQDPVDGPHPNGDRHAEHSQNQADEIAQRYVPSEVTFSTPSSLSTATPSRTESRASQYDETSAPPPVSTSRGLALAHADLAFGTSAWASIPLVDARNIVSHAAAEL